MNISEFSKLPEFEDMDDMGRLEVGDKFLYGNNVKAQKQNKKMGDEICYYVVISKSDIGVEYTPVFEILDNDIKGEEKK